MRALILAAGFGTRMKPITDHITKALIPVAGLPLLARNLLLFYNQNIHDIAVNTHHGAEQIEAFQLRSKIPFSIFHEADKIRGTGGALHFARDFLAQDSVFCVCNAEPIKILDINSLWEQFACFDCECALATVPASTGGTIFYDAESKEFRGTKTQGTHNDTCAAGFFIGLALYKKEALDLFTDTDFSVVPVWQRIQMNGGRVKIIETPNIYWRDIGTPHELAQIHFDVLGGRVDIQLPSNLVFDQERKRVYPKQYTHDMLDAIGEFSWMEADTLPPGCRIGHSIVFAGTQLQPNAVLDHCIATPWEPVIDIL